MGSKYMESKYGGLILNWGQDMSQTKPAPQPAVQTYVQTYKIQSSKIWGPSVPSKDMGSSCKGSQNT